MNKKQLLGVAGGVAGLLTAGAAAVVAAEKVAVGRIRLRPDPDADEPFGQLRGQALKVLTDDGVSLHVEVDGVPDAPLTVVFVHGYTLNQDVWHYQRRDLRSRVRLVFVDQRCHGRSERGPRGPVTIDQLGADLAAVLRATVPDGSPVVLAGHSMGGMTIMALAEQHPELFGTQVIGAALISTSPGRIAEVTFGLPAALGVVLRRLAPGTVSLLGRRPQLVERGRRVGGDLLFLATRMLAFSDPKVSPSTVEFLDRMIAATPVDVVADFYPTLMQHDKLACLPVLDRVPTLVLVGERDRMTPREHSEAIAEAVPSADLVVVPEAGHLVILERPTVVNDALCRLIERATTGEGLARCTA